MTEQADNQNPGASDPQRAGGGGAPSEIEQLDESLSEMTDTLLNSDTGDDDLDFDGMFAEIGDTKRTPPTYEEVASQDDADAQGGSEGSVSEQFDEIEAAVAAAIDDADADLDSPPPSAPSEPTADDLAAELAAAVTEELGSGGKDEPTPTPDDVMAAVAEDIETLSGDGQDTPPVTEEPAEDTATEDAIEPEEVAPAAPAEAVDDETAASAEVPESMEIPASALPKPEPVPAADVVAEAETGLDAEAAASPTDSAHEVDEGLDAVASALENDASSEGAAEAAEPEPEAAAPEPESTSEPEPTPDASDAASEPVAEEPRAVEPEPATAEAAEPADAAPAAEAPADEATKPTPLPVDAPSPDAQPNAEAESATDNANAPAPEPPTTAAVEVSRWAAGRRAVVTAYSAAAVRLGPLVRRVGEPVLNKAGDLTAKGAESLAASFAGQSKLVRHSIAWIALWTLFNAGVLWAYLGLFRSSGVPPVSGAGTQITDTSGPGTAASDDAAATSEE